MIIREISEAINYPMGTIKYIVKSLLEKDSEFKTIRGLALQTFKRSNPQYKINGAQISVIFKNGLSKIARLLNSES
jgi:hypothetical protein